MYEKRVKKPSAKAAAAAKSPVLQSIDVDEDELSALVTQPLPIVSAGVPSLSLPIDDDGSTVHDPDYNDKYKQRVNLPPEPVEFEIVTEEVQRGPIYQTKLSLDELFLTFIERTILALATLLVLLS